jgi:hypothetical protein
MKKIFLGSIALTIFSISIIIFEVSCQKKATAQNGNNSTYILPPATNSVLGGIIVGSGLSITNNGTLSVNTANSTPQQLGKILYIRTNDAVTPHIIEYWTMNYDGTNNTKVPINLPSGFFAQENVQVSPDGQTIFFNVRDASKSYIYKCKIDGTGLSKLLEAPSNITSIGISLAY